MLLLSAGVGSVSLLSQVPGCSAEAFTFLYPNPAYVPYIGGNFITGWMKSVFSNCPSQAVSTASWIIVTSGPSPGSSGTAFYTVQPGMAEPRIGIIQVGSVGSIADRTDYTVIQAGVRDPVITTQLLPTARQGVPYSVQIAAASPVPSGSFLWGLTGGPAGLALSPSGLLSGTPFQSGFFTVNITAALPGSVYRASRSFGLKVVSSSPSMFFRTTPCRVMDTRAGSGKTGDFGPPSLPAGGFRFLPIPNSGCGVPSSAVAYSLNVTVVPKGPLGYLSIWPVDDVPVDRTSTLNSLDGAIVANAAVVPAGPPPFNGLVVFASDETDVIIDINGYFGPPDLQGLVFYPVRPCRLADTRVGSGHTGAFGPPSLTAGATREIPVPDGPCRIPTTAQAYALNLTVVPAGPLGYLSAWPAGQPRPLVSTLNSLDGRVVANAAITVAGANGAISIYASDTTDVVIDVNGYFAPPGAGAALSFYLLSPCRAADTRPGSGFTGAFGAPALVEGATRDFPLTSGVCGIPSSALAFALNVTVVPPGPLFYLSLWPAGHPQPFVSTLNSYLGKIVSNAAIAGAGTNGTVSVFSTNPTELILDVNGFFAP